MTDIHQAHSQGAFRRSAMAWNVFQQSGRGGAAAAGTGAYKMPGWDQVDGAAPAAGRSAASRLARLRRLAWLLDASLRVPGTQFRFGLESLVGLVPLGGDLVMAGVSLYIVREAWALGAPAPILTRMLANVAADAVVGGVPVLGDVFDAAFKANLRNIALLEKYLEGQAGRGTGR